MSETLLDAVNSIIGQDGDDFGFRYAVNHDDASTDSTAGATAEYALEFKLKMEADPSLMSSQDLSTDFPAVYFNPVGSYPAFTTRGDHTEASFTVDIYVVAENTNGVSPREAGRELAVKVVENIMALDKLGLTWVDSVECLGVLDDPFTQQLHLLLPRMYAGGARFVVWCRGMTW